MIYSHYYNSPLGKLQLISDGKCLTGINFEGYAIEAKEGYTAVFENTKKWLDMYFDRRQPNFVPDIRFEGSTFQISVWKKLLKIPYGKTVTYGSIAKEIASERGIKVMSAQAVGGAVNKNPIPIIVPCHRVIGSSGGLVGYAAGLNIKTALLSIEGIVIDTI